YGQKSFEAQLQEKRPVLVVSKEGRDGSIGINQDADMYITRLDQGGKASLELRESRGAWIQVVRGKITVNGNEIATGDAISIEEKGQLNFGATEESEFIVFDLA
ncbi:MAG: pirin family protein, partial [Bdellovibrionota bacterium]